MTLPAGPVPSSRSFSAGDFAVRQYKALSGAEIRIRYGNLRLESTLELVYENITDANAKLFLDGYNSTFGTFNAFTLPNTHSVFNGWASDKAALNSASNTRWRYSGPPEVESVIPGRSTVRVSLISVV